MISFAHEEENRTSASNLHLGWVQGQKLCGVRWWRRLQRWLDCEGSYLTAFILSCPIPGRTTGLCLKMSPPKIRGHPPVPSVPDSQPPCPKPSQSGKKPNTTFLTSLFHPKLFCWHPGKAVPTHQWGHSAYKLRDISQVTALDSL